MVMCKGVGQQQYLKNPNLQYSSQEEKFNLAGRRERKLRQRQKRRAGCPREGIRFLKAFHNSSKQKDRTDVWDGHGMARFRVAFELI